MLNPVGNGRQTSLHRSSPNLMIVRTPDQEPAKLTLAEQYFQRWKIQRKREENGGESAITMGRCQRVKEKGALRQQ